MESLCLQLGRVWKYFVTSLGTVFEKESAPKGRNSETRLQNTSKICTMAEVFSCSGVPRNFVRRRGGGCSTNSVEDRGQREQGSGGSSPIVMGSGGSRNLVQEISFHVVKFS
jgi:hypothetical protein